MKYKDKILKEASILQEFTIDMIISELGLKRSRLEQMMIAEVLKSAGYKKKQVRFNHKTLRVVWNLGSENKI